MSSSKLTYLASPYSHRYAYIRQRRFEQVCKKAAELMQQGEQVFAPIAHSHPIEILGMNGRQSGDWWLKQDYAVLKNCSKLVVYKIPGWDKSYGVAEEIKFAKKNKIPIEYAEFS